MRRALLFVLLGGLGACDDYVIDLGGAARPGGGGSGAGGGSGEPGTDPLDPSLQGFCAVDALFRRDCVVCHSAATHLGGLDLQTDAHVALVDVPSTLDPARRLVVPGDPDASFLVAKLDGALGAGLGGRMPPTAPVDAGVLERVRTWIAEGAAPDCDAPVDVVPADRFHPDGYALVEAHGPDAKLQALVCTDCHGPTLDGVGAAVSCDVCHTPDDPPAWRTDCTFCHGDPADGTGAPPVHLSGADDGRSASFVPHRAHTDGSSRAAPIACTACHAEPDDILSAGHLFVGDRTPGRAETSFLEGIAPQTTWTATTGTCASTTCHGSGRGPDGTVQHLGRVDDCADCHPSMASSQASWRAMSGRHRDHLWDVGSTCGDCHAATANAAGTGIVDPTVHVDGAVQIALPAALGVTWNGATCAGTCHTHLHTSEDRWR